MKREWPFYASDKCYSRDISRIKGWLWSAAWGCHWIKQFAQPPALAARQLRQDAAKPRRNYQTTLYIVTSLFHCCLFLPTSAHSSCPSIRGAIASALFLSLFTLLHSNCQPCQLSPLHLLAPEEPAKRGTGTNAYAHQHHSPSPRTVPIANTTQPTRKGSEASKPHPQCQLYHYLTMQPRRNCPRWPSPFAASSRISPPYYRGTASSPDGLPHLQTLSAKPLLSRRAQLPA